MTNQPEFLLTNFNTLAQLIHQQSVKSGFKESIWKRLLLITSEVSEATEELREGHHSREIYFNHDRLVNAGSGVRLPKPEGVPIELADVIIRCLDLCAAEGINIEAAMELKLVYNKHRPHKHGKVN